MLMMRINIPMIEYKESLSRILRGDVMVHYVSDWAKRLHVVRFFGKEKNGYKKVNESHP